MMGAQGRREPACPNDATKFTDNFKSGFLSAISGPFQTFSVLEIGNVDHNAASQSEASAAFPFLFQFPHRGGNRSFPSRFRNQTANGNDTCLRPGCTRVQKIGKVEQ
jgi:hypothetical protein